MRKFLKLFFISLFLLFTSAPINPLLADTLTTLDPGVEVEENHSQESEKSEVVRQSPTPTAAKAITELTAKSKWNTSFFLEGVNILEATKIPSDAIGDVTWKAINPYTNVTFKNPNSLITNVTIKPPSGINELNTKYTVPGYEYNFEVSSKNDPTIKATTSLIFGGLRAQVTKLNSQNIIQPDKEAFNNFVEYLKKNYLNSTVNYKWKTYKYTDTIFWAEQSNGEAERQGYSGIEGSFKVDNSNEQDIPIPTLSVTPKTAQRGRDGPQDSRVKIEFTIHPADSIFTKNVSSNLALVKVSSQFPELTSVPNFTYQIGILGYNNTEQDVLLPNLEPVSERITELKQTKLIVRNESEYKYEVTSKMTVFSSDSSEHPLTSDIHITFKQGKYKNIEDIIAGSSRYQHMLCQECISTDVQPVDNEWIFDMLGENAMLLIKNGRQPLPNQAGLHYKATILWNVTITDPISKSL